MLKNFAFLQLGGEVVEVFHQHGTDPFMNFIWSALKEKFPASQAPRFNASWFSVLMVHKSAVYRAVGHVGNTEILKTSTATIVTTK
jgi:hypothetical protein